MPIVFDPSRNVWVVHDISELRPGHVVNMLQWGQPYTPYESGFNHEIYENGYESPPTMAFSNQNAMMHFGQNVQLDMFDVVRNFTSGAHNLPDGTYSFDDLVNRGLATGGDFGDHRISTNLYGTGNFDINSNLRDLPNLMYIFGSVRFEIQPGAEFIIEDGEFIVNASIGVISDDFDYDSTSFPANILNPFIELTTGPDHNNYERVILIYEGEGASRSVRVINESDFCFLSGTSISMWPLDLSLGLGADGRYDEQAVLAKVWQKPIEEVAPDDRVLSFDNNGDLKPGTVTRLFRNEAKIILDFFGTFVTPGHVCYRPDSRKADKFEPLIDILREDGEIKHQDGTPIRAATGVPVGDPRDRFVWAIAGTASRDGAGICVREKGQLRLGARFIFPDGRDFCIADLIEIAGGVVTDEGLIRVGDSEMPFHWSFSEQLPNPENYILQRSGTTLVEIYRAAEWEGRCPSSPAPMVMDGAPVQPFSQSELADVPRNMPLALRGGAYAAAKRPMLAGRSTRNSSMDPRKSIEADRGKWH